MKWCAFLLLVACNHKNCGDNGAERYGRYIDPNITCLELRRGEHEEDDYALCTSGIEDWLCHGKGTCRPLGPPIKLQRVMP